MFVAGKRSGAIWENEPVVGYFPRKNELVGTTFDVNREVEDCARLSEQARQEADDAVQAAKFREAARERFIEEGRDPDDESELKSAIFRERKMWIRERTTELGAERAEYWGWTNIYTYSKSLAEQIIASQDDIVKNPCSAFDRRVVESVPVSWLERGLYDDRAAYPHRLERPAYYPGK
jgi:long-chain acyl-CoA synthetase